MIAPFLYTHYSSHLSRTLTVCFLISFAHVFISHSSLLLTEALITAINNDIEEAKVNLELPEHLKLRDDNFFTSAPTSSSALPPTTASTSQAIMNGHWQLAVAAAPCAHTHQNNTEVSLYTQVRVYVLIKMHSLILRSICCRHGCTWT